MGKETTNKQSKRLSQRRKLQRGQSLMEMALSLTMLILVFSGAIDLGRAFYTKITLDSAVSEGAHWMAAYPGCAIYGGAFGEANNVMNAPSTCKGTNSIVQRIRNESSLMLPSSVKSVYLSITPGQLDASGTAITRMDQVQPGVTLSMTVEYNMNLFTPVMKAMFGDVWILSSQAQEVIRGTSVPDTTGKTSTYVPVVTTVPMVTSLVQDMSANNQCNNGYPPMTWNKPATGVMGTDYMGYELWAVDAGTGQPIGASPLETKTDSSATITSWGSMSGTQIDPTKGGNQMYGVRSYKTSGSPVTYTYSDFLYIVATCPKAQPVPTTALCDTVGTPPAYVTFSWSMPSYNYDWEALNGINIKQDATITGYKLYKLDLSNNPQPATDSGTGLPVVFSGGNTRTGQLNFSSPTDANRNGTYRLQPVNSSGTPIGVISDSFLDFSVGCS
jgi:Flp pilus assembly protein TadG